ncbi:hypothetical protein FNU76_00455 [Chitinimonas arctica]|uniref:HEPN AbiU2-like domain-containing protein n=1 Tax=Chitinimonas arctica TaxID=2594795 RepID=A0A516S9X5_9NEIS|nr:hypothetical protein [Chitinimonas arctica]QDQ24937.1 hypothetical protein FNU76_00455 [Chitinimonas arctica]
MLLEAANDCVKSRSGGPYFLKELRVSTMTREKRLRRVAILCCHFLLNLAFYKSGYRNGRPIFKDRLKDPFWVAANNNFLDTCVLEWCKLFGDKRGKQYWGRHGIITDPVAFHDALLCAIGLTSNEFEDYIKGMQSYRDKFVAHLDLEETMEIPKLRIARKSVSFLYDYMLANENEGDYFNDARPKAVYFYREHRLQSRGIYVHLYGSGYAS